MFKFRVSLFALLITVPFSAQAAPVAYTFSGTLSGFMLWHGNLVDVPFQISIYGDTDNVFATGYVAGAGPGFANNSIGAIWEVDGMGTAVSNDAQIYTIPGLGRVGFGWDGQVFPLNTNQPAQANLFFNGNAIAMDSDYSRLSSVVAPAPVALQTTLYYPNASYTTSIYFADLNSSLTLTALTNVSYSVAPVPLPGAAWLLGSGLIGLIGVVHRKAA